MDDVRDRSVDDDTFPVVEDDVVPAMGDATGSAVVDGPYLARRRSIGVSRLFWS